MAERRAHPRHGTRYGVRFRIICAADWKTQSLDLEATDGRGVHVVADEEAHWSNRDGTRLPIVGISQSYQSRPPGVCQSAQDRWVRSQRAPSCCT